jgi:hypothetical protein
MDIVWGTRVRQTRKLLSRQGRRRISALTALSPIGGQLHMLTGGYEELMGYWIVS